MQAYNDFVGCAQAECPPSSDVKSQKNFYVCVFDFTPTDDNLPIHKFNYITANSECTECPVHKKFCKDSLCCKF